MISPQVWCLRVLDQAVQSVRVLLVIFLAIMFTGGTLGLVSAVTQATMVEEVNRRLPEDQRFEDAWWGPDKIVRLFREYRRLYPDGPLLRRQIIIFSIGAFVFGAAAIASFF